jgi:class 3 adenylate cyclase/predicted ATPase
MDVAAWLSNLGLERYKQVFEENAIDFALLPKLTPNDLREIGITAVGDRRRLLEAIAALPLESRTPLGSPHPRVRDAERRQLTVMFIDLVGSTSLTGQLDPEDMREVLTAYQGCCVEIVGRFEGYVAKLMGDGVLVYFGWPVAHEDDVERSVRAGLDVVAAVSALRPHGKLKLAARVGISTGDVVVGDLVGAGAAQEQAVVGEAPNLAARIQSLAEAETVLIGPSTRKLLGAVFKCVDLGERVLAGVKEPVRVWRVLRPSRMVSRFDALRGAMQSPLVGRYEESVILRRNWELAKQGKGQAVVVTGEPGIGKSRLVRAFSEAIESEPHTPLLYQCSSIQMGRALHPIVSQMEHALHFAPEDRTEEKVEKLRGLMERAVRPSPEDLAIFAALLSLPGGEGFAELEPDPNQRKKRIFSAILRQFEGLAGQHTVLCIFEDVHWSDPSSRELLHQLVEWIPDFPMLLLLTCRLEFSAPWFGLSHSTRVSLRRLSSSETTELVTGVAGGRQLPDAVVRRILPKADGIPLFIEELTRAVIESGKLRPTNDGYVLTDAIPELAVPATLHDSLMARLDRLPRAREIAQMAASIGPSLTYRLLSAVAECDQKTLRASLLQLEEAGLLLRHGLPPVASYSFKHALIQETAYRSMLRATRQRYHRRIAGALEHQSPGRTRMDAALLAHHYAEGDLIEPAIRCFRRAGETAIEASAFAEAIDNFSRSLALLERMPDSPERAREEIAVRLALGAAQFQILRGSPEVEQSYLRTLELCERFGNPQERIAALWGLWYNQFQQGHIHRSRDYGDQLLPIAQDIGDSSLLLEAHHVRWGTMSALGEFRMALAHTQQGIGRYDVKEHQRLTFVYGGHDPGVCAYNINSVMLCVLGYPEQAQGKSHAALALAREVAHPNTLAQAYFFALLVAFLVSNVARVDQLAADLDGLVRGGNAPPGYSVDPDSFRGWFLAERGSTEEGLELMRRWQRVWRGWHAWSLPQGACLAALLGRVGLVGEALELIGGGFDAAERGGAHWYDAELYRIRAALRRAINGDDWVGAEKDLQKSIETARMQHARHFELRAATDLAQVWAERGQRQKARDLLAPIVGWFTEGLDTPYLVSARACLATLGA